VLGKKRIGNRARGRQIGCVIRTENKSALSGAKTAVRAAAQGGKDKDGSSYVKRSFVLILVALLLSVANDGHCTSQKNRSTQDKRETTIEADSANQREHQTENLLSAIEAEQANIVELIKTISDENETQQEKNRTDNTPWPLLSGLTPFKVQQGLLIVGALYTFFAAWQLVQIRRQAKISRRALISQQRARIQIRGIPPIGQILQTAMLACFVTIVNRGGTKARISESNCTIRFDANPAIPVEIGVKQPGPPYSEERASFKKETLKPGETCLAVAKYSGGENASRLTEAAQFQADQRFFYVFGYIKYRDESGLPHETAFCRRLDRLKGIFVLVNNPDYEYEE